MISSRSRPTINPKDAQLFDHNHLIDRPNWRYAECLRILAKVDDPGCWVAHRGNDEFVVRAIGIVHALHTADDPYRIEEIRRKNEVLVSAIRHGPEALRRDPVLAAVPLAGDRSDELFDQLTGLSRALSMWIYRLYWDIPFGDEYRWTDWVCRHMLMPTALDEPSLFECTFLYRAISLQFGLIGLYDSIHPKKMHPMIEAFANPIRRASDLAEALMYCRGIPRQQCQSLVTQVAVPEWSPLGEGISAPVVLHDDEGNVLSEDPRDESGREIQEVCKRLTGLREEAARSA